jgi:ATP-binding cassette subfamily B protein
MREAPAPDARSLPPERLAASPAVEAAEALDAAELEACLAALALPPRRRRRARRAFLATVFATAPRPTGATTCSPPNDRTRPRRSAHTPRWIGPAATLLLATAAAQLLAGSAWLLLARGALATAAEPAWWPAWALLLATVAALQGAAQAATHRLRRQILPILRRRRFAGLLRHPPRGARAAAAGRGLAAILAAEAFDEAAWAAGPVVIEALVALAGAVWLLLHAAAAPAPTALLLVALAVAALLAAGHARAATAATRCRLESTARITEALAGQRTRLAAGWGPPDATDRALAATGYAAARRLARREAALRVLLPEVSWLAGLSALVPAAARAAAAGPGRLAAALSGVLVARAGLAQLGAALCQLGAAWSAQRAARPILEPPAATPRLRQRDPGADPGLALRRGGTAAPRLLEARDLALSAGAVGEERRPLLRRGQLEIRPGDRLVLGGPSGAGKSTLAAVLAGQQLPASGLLLLSGLDLTVWGRERWRQQVVLVPQLHENHLFADTLGWNLLLGRSWPPSPADLAEAAALCAELGLGDLLARCPAGLDQRIGEGGWQLSDGEASRVCVARALLQRPALLILDESLAALDPATRGQVLAVVDRRAAALMLVAHASARVPHPAAATGDGSAGRSPAAAISPGNSSRASHR